MSLQPPPPKPVLKNSSSYSPSESSSALPNAADGSMSQPAIHFPSNVTPSTERPPNLRGNSFTRTRTVSSGEAGAQQYRAKVGFELDESDDTPFTFTLQASSEGFAKTRQSRLFLVAVSPDESGEEALDWLLESLVEEGDEIVALRVIDWEEKPSARKEQDLKDDAHELLKEIAEKNDDIDEDRKISIVVEFVVGKITEQIMRLIALYRPDSLIVGTKGSRGKLQAFGEILGTSKMGSVSRYCVSHSSVPCIVVRPERKVKKTLAKREKDPSRRGQYGNLMGPPTVRTR